MPTMLTKEELTVVDPTEERMVNLDLRVSELALRRVRAGFNPDKMPEIGSIHLLAACLITLLESHHKDFPARLDANAPEHEHNAYQRDLFLTNETNRLISLAVTNVELASMWGVKAATAQTYADKNMR